MAMAGGSVTVDAVGNEVVVAGLSADLYTQMKASSLVTLGTFGQTLPPSGPQLGLILRGIAATSNVIGQTVVAYFQANGQVKVATTVAGLQRMSNPVAASSDCQGPTADKFLPIV